MIRVGNNNPHAYYETSHISTPQKTYAYETRKRELPPTSMRKVSSVYVGDKHVYPELFRYTLKYRSRVDFTFHGVSHGNYRPSSTYCEATTTGYIEDIVRLDTVFPTYIRAQPLVSPGDHYIPHSSSGQYSQPPWGRIEQRQFSGTEYLITPVCALSGAIPGTGGYNYGSSWSYGTGIYEKYAGRRISMGNKGVWRYIMQRTVHSTTTHQVRRNWECDDVVTNDYTIRARRTNNPYTDISEAFFKGMYANCGMIASSFPIKRSNEYGYLSLGMTYRSENDPGEDGIFLMTDMDHYGSSNDVFYAGSHSFYGCPPGDIGQHDRGFSVEAPMFSGHKHFDCYDSGWNVGRQDITGWDDPRMDEWSHTDLNGSFTILENNNPAFGSIAEYVRAYTG